MKKSLPIPSLLKLLAVALFFPVITGFAGEDSNSTPPTTEALGPAASAKGTTAGAPPPLSYNWRRTKAGSPDAMAQASDVSASTGDLNWNGVSRREKVHSWETGEGKSYLIPAIEVPAFLLLLNMYDRVVYGDEESEGKKTYNSNFSTTWQHLRDQNWGFDDDPFNVNQFGHPYQGATMYGLARSCGLGFWESWAYSNAGSFLYEMAGETTRPSINDMITTGNSGSLLGEALFRMSQLVLQQKETPDAWHEIGAAVVSPPTAFNRYAFGNRFKEVFPNYAPATFWRFRVGAVVDSEDDAILDFAMSYGLPGKPGYSYKRPLDYFDFQISALSSASNPIGNVLLRGLLYGKSYEAGQRYRGIWGVYGSYDYISPATFRVSTTAVSLGTTAQWWLAPYVAMQGTLLGGVGFGGAGVTPVQDGERDYHYGVTPQGTLALRLLLWDRIALETVGRGYYVSGTGSDNSDGSEKIYRINSNFIYRFWGRHGISVQVIEAIRHAQYGNLPTRNQSDLSVGFFYTFLGDASLGAVEWREPGQR